MKELKAERLQLEKKRDTLEAAYQEGRGESKDLSAARVAVESQLGMKGLAQQKDSVIAQEPRKMNLSERIEFYKGEAEKQKAELIKDNQHRRKPGFDRDGPSR